MEYEEGQIMRWLIEKDERGRPFVRCPDCGTAKDWVWHRCPLCTACGLKLEPPEGCKR